MGYSDLRSFAQGSAMGGGKASKAITRNLGEFGHLDPDNMDGQGDTKYSLGGIIAKAMDQGEGKQGDNMSLMLEALGQKTPTVGAAGDTYISDGGEGEEGLEGMQIAQPGALTKNRQYLLTGHKVEDGSYDIGGKPGSAEQSPLLQKYILNKMLNDKMGSLYGGSGSGAMF